MVSQATARFVKGSATKVRLVADKIRGRNVHEALGTLELSTRRASRHLEKVLRSAVANAENIDPGIDVDDLIVAEVFVNQGPSLPTRIRPQPMGRAFRVLKRQSHVTIKLDTRKGESS